MLRARGQWNSGYINWEFPLIKLLGRCQEILFVIGKIHLKKVGNIPQETLHDLTKLRIIIVSVENAWANFLSPIRAVYLD